jgi:pyridinium-3,5-biscarboxylic acid mononucleotide sulfurtransferase
MDATELHARLVAALDRHPDLTVAVSGGVDSMTLAFVAHRFAKGRIGMVHATSPAVPALATERVRRYAAAEGWQLTVADAGEFADPAYRANPVDRCYFCKSNLYDSIRSCTGGAVASGANLDDLDDYRPGLMAAAERQVVHPFVEAGIDKAGVRRLAHHHGLLDIAELPAQPCLASRVETGIRIDPADMAFIDTVEGRLRQQLGDGTTLRCRITLAGVAVEVDDAASGAEAVAATAGRLCAEQGRIFVGVRPYRRGAAFKRMNA